MECLNVIKHQSLLKLCFSFIVCTSFTTLSACNRKQSINNLSVTSLDPSNISLEVTILDTGKSDCIFIEIGDKTIMIDTGLDRNGEQILASLHEKGIDHIDYLILTHLDKDHIGGADIILDEIPVDQVIQANYSKDSTQYQEYIDALSRHDITPLLLTQTMNLKINDAQLTLYPAQQTEYEQSNDYSIITSLIYGENSFLFAGDAESQRLTEFLNLYPSTYKFLKIPHHGNDNDVLPLFLNTLKPDYAVLSWSDVNAPDQKVISILNQLGTQTLLTSDGAISIKCTENQMSVNQQLTQYISFESN